MVHVWYYCLQMKSNYIVHQISILCYLLTTTQCVVHTFLQLHNIHLINIYIDRSTWSSIYKFNFNFLKMGENSGVRLQISNWKLGNWEKASPSRRVYVHLHNWSHWFFFFILYILYILLVRPDFDARRTTIRTSFWTSFLSLHPKVTFCVCG